MINYEAFSGRLSCSDTTRAAVSYLSVPDDADVTLGKVVTVFFDNPDDATRFLQRHYSSIHMPILEWMESTTKPLFPFRIDLAVHDQHGVCYGNSDLLNTLVRASQQELGDLHGRLTYSSGYSSKRVFSYYEATGIVRSIDTMDVTFYAMDHQMHGVFAVPFAEHTFTDIRRLLIPVINQEKLNHATSLFNSHVQYLQDREKRRTIRNMLMTGSSSLKEAHE